jgi:acyl carrier protein
VAGDVAVAVRDVLGRYSQHTRLREASLDDVSLTSLGIASVDMISIIIELEEALDRIIDQGQLHELRTVGDLVRALEVPSG